MSGGWGDRFKRTLRGAGDGVRKLTQHGQLRVELLEAESDLKTRHRELGVAIADLVIDRGEAIVNFRESALAPLIDAVRHARNKVGQIREEIEGIG